MSFYREKPSSDSDTSDGSLQISDDESSSDENSFVIGTKRRNKIHIIDSDEDEEESALVKSDSVLQTSNKNHSSAESSALTEKFTSSNSKETIKTLSSISTINNDNEESVVSISEDTTKRLCSLKEKGEDSSQFISSSFDEHQYTKRANSSDEKVSQLKEVYSATDDEDTIDDTSELHSVLFVSGSDVEESPNNSIINSSNEIENGHSPDSSILNFTDNIGNVPTSTVLDISDNDNVPANSGSPEKDKTRTIPDTDKTKVFVSDQEYRMQKEKVLNTEREFTRLAHLKATLQLSTLADKGEKLLNHMEVARQKYEAEKVKLERMVVKAEENVNKRPFVDMPKPLTERNPERNPFFRQFDMKEVRKEPTWDDLKANAAAVQPKTFGKTALNTLNTQKTLTLDALRELHGSLKSCPDENVLAEDPKGLKVSLMPHQKRSLAWILWREKQTPSGGILADDMGLGKTLTMIAHILQTKEEDDAIKNGDENDWRDNKVRPRGGNLIVCPASLFKQWEGEIKSKCKKGLLSVELYHGPKRERSNQRLARFDVVITTYAIVMNEASDGTIFKIRWRRIILDEAHQIRNHKCQTSVAVCNLKARSRWALTGTPVHNKELDLYSQLKFLRCAPFDDLAVWKRWVADKSTGGQERLNTVISSLMLRRTKVELQEQGFLKELPQRKWELIHCKLDDKEMYVYQKLLLFSRNLFAQFLKQRAEKNTAWGVPTSATTMHGPNGEYYRLHKQLTKHNGVKEIQQHHILVLLLRLRQICCHPSLILKMLKGNDDASLDEYYEEEEDEHLNLLDQLNKLKLDDEVHENVAEGLSQEGTSLAEASRNVLNPSNPVFSSERESSKIKTLLKLMQEKLMSSNDKAIIVSQWSGLLTLLGKFLKKENIQFDQLDGSVPVYKRDLLVSTFNDPKSSVKVLLLSLTAGGVGLNLMGANHLFLLDLHWNPQLEVQAQDRIYRVGQTKPVFIYKFVVNETIEEQIMALQEKKINIADAVMTGTKISNKLTIDDLKMLFNM